MTSLAAAAAAAALPAPRRPDVLSFYGQPWWMILLKVVVIFAFLMFMTLFAIWAERRVIGRMQQRPGPNRAGPFGLLQSLMDGHQAAAQRGHRPPARGQAAVLAGAGDLGDPRVRHLRDHPVRPRSVDLRLRTPLQLTDLPVAVLLVLVDELDGRLRDRAGGLVLGVAVLAARRAALVCAGGQLRDRDGAVLRRGVPVRGIAVHHRRSCSAQAHGARSTWAGSPCTTRRGSRCCCSPRSSST